MIPKGIETTINIMHPAVPILRLDEFILAVCANALQPFNRRIGNGMSHVP